MDPEDGEELTRLDPDAVSGPPTPRPPSEPAPAPAPVIDVRPYRWAIGVVGVAVVVGFSLIGFLGHHRTTTGVAPGERLRFFAAPLATSDLRGVANLHPPCTEARHDPRALNLCLDARRSAVVLSLFVPASSACVRQVDALQALSRRFSADRVAFVAVAVGASRARAAALVRAHRWTIPVAADPDGAVGEEYGVVICPLAELARRGGIVADRLIGDRWQGAAALAPRVAALVAGR